MFADNFDGDKVAKKDEEAAKEAAKDAEEAAAMNLVSIS
jgi:hypothetical protein